LWLLLRLELALLAAAGSGLAAPLAIGGIVGEDAQVRVRGWQGEGGEWSRDAKRIKEKERKRAYCSDRGAQSQ